MSDIDHRFLGYDLDLDEWRRRYDAVIAEHGGRKGCGFTGVLADQYAQPGELELLGFIGCCHWLNGAGKTKGFADASTYGMKHKAERMMRRRGGPYYVSQNILEMAALYEGFAFHYPYGCPNPSLNISKVDLTGARRSQPSIDKYYWFQHQPVITYPVTPTRPTAQEWRERVPDEPNPKFIYRSIGL